MANIYDEFERAVGGKRGRGIGILGGLLLAILSLFLVGALGVGVAAWFVHDRVQHVARVASMEIAHAMEVSPVTMAADLMERMESQTRIVSMDPEAGLDFLQDVPLNAPPEDFLQEVLTGDLWQEFGGDAVRAVERSVDRRAVLRDQDGSVSIDLVKGKDGGTLVIGSEEGEVRFDLQRTGKGGHLTMVSPDGVVHMELTRTGTGGFLTIDSEEGQVRVDLVRKGEGGELTVRGPEGTLRFGAGEGAEPMPRWVPQLSGVLRDPQGVYSLSAPDGFLGAVAWESDDTAREILGFYQDLLVREGFDMRVRHRVRDTERDYTQSSLWARDEAARRMVFLVAEQRDGTSRVLLGYGEER